MKIKVVRLEFGKGEYRLIEKNSNRVVSRSPSEKKCMEFLVNNDAYAYEPTMRKDVHYVL